MNILGSNISYIENLYEKYLKDSNSVDVSWQQFFKGFDLALQFNTKFKSSTSNKNRIQKEVGVRFLIEAYRNRGHS